MANIKISYMNNFDSIVLDSATEKKVAAVREALKAAITDTAYTTPYASVYVPRDEVLLNTVRAHAQEVGTIDLCVVIGIGGSSLGFRAVYDALQDQATLPPQNVLVLETVDTPSVQTVLTQIEAALAKKQRVYVSVISKSGTTTETIALWRVVQPLLKKYNPQTWQKQVTIITDAGSPLEQYAQEHKIAVLQVPKLVGGRYSAFSPVGLFPLMLCGIDADRLLAGAREAMQDALAAPRDTMPYQHAIALYAAYQKGYAVHDTFIFSAGCSTIGLWYRQLAAESLGKMRTSDKKVMNMIPTVSIGSTDLHSIGQFYLSGAHNFWTTFFIVQERDELRTDTDHSLDACVASLNDRSLAEIMHAITRGTMQAYQDLKIPFSVITLSERSPHTIGYLMQSYMLAIMYAGALLNVNPFDQPDVERYKAITRKLLQQ